MLRRLERYRGKRKIRYVLIDRYCKVKMDKNNIEHESANGLRKGRDQYTAPKANTAHDIISIVGVSTAMKNLFD
jgi:hypothetical protein